MKNNRLPQGSKRYLYILAGPSGSGKTTFLRSAAKVAAPIFGEDNREHSYIKLLAQLGQGESRTIHAQPIEVTAGGVLSMSDFLAMARFGLSPACVTFLHIDLSFAIKLGYDYPGQDFWHHSIGILDPLKIELFDVNSFGLFWRYMFQDFLSGTAFSLEFFDGIGVNTLTAPRQVIVASKVARDKKKRHSQRWHHVYNAIYANTDLANRAYRAHLAGWGQWVKELCSIHSVRQATAESIHEERQFLVRSECGEFRVSAS